ncbi:CrcB family protein [Alkalihalophilus lindianensis]|uniref:Fluoride-specific ion channel FluC n=1 Tax=Alkalihalophilus lindianensis TaxID=1630542 RepID=A0ABU3X549_9BACI|nr:CrcB family protein [Alkalihalophilus lindianensis]MDV2683015.1 CrcB family protein [Alkalihalophilus lindianensis]
MNNTYKNILAIGVGGAIGTFLRYFFNVLTLELGYPLGTIIENLGGSLLLGFLTAWFIVFIPREWIKVGLGVGLCGGFTTMSTFAADSIFLYSRTPIDAIFYIVLSLFGGILFALGGYLVATRLATKTRQKMEGGR